MNKKLSSSLLSLLAISLMLLFTSASCKKKNNNTPQTGTITTIVSNSPDFSILKAAVIKAGLAATLDGKGPFTVFAPTNDAFKTSGITLETVNSLSPDALKGILLYHTLGTKELQQMCLPDLMQTLKL